MSEEKLISEHPTQKRLLLLYSLALGLLLLIGLFCWLFLAPYVRTRAAVKRCEETGYVFDEALSRLGGPAKAAQQLSLYIRLPERLAPHRDMALIMLAQCGEPGRVAVPTIVKLLNEKNLSVRCAALRALAVVGDARAVEPLIVVLKERETEVYGLAARALGKTGDIRAVEPLIALLKEPRDVDDWFAPEAIEALGNLKSPLAVEPLIAILKDKNEDDEYVRARAANALGKINDYRAVPALFVALGDHNKYVHRRSWAALLGMTAPRSTPHFIAALRSPDWEARSIAARVLGILRDPSAIEPLKQRLKDKDENVRRAAREALASIPGAVK